MTALAEALLAAQRQAIGALSKAWLAAPESDDEFADLLTDLDAIGCTDKIEQAYYISCLRALKTLGAASPAPTGQANESRKAPEAASDQQRKYIADLCKRQNVPAPDHIGSKDEASAIIEALKAGTYNADAYSVPF